MTVTKRGAALDPRSREYDWIQAVVDVVAKQTGQNSRWSGKVFLEEGDALGTADAAGTMTVSNDKVLAPLRRAFAGEELTDDELFQLRDALVTLVHESLHLTGNIGHIDEQGQVEYTVADLALEEGLTETWSQQNVDNAIYRLGLDERYPSLVNQRAMDAYPALQAASTKLVQGVATLSDLRETEVVRRLQGAEWNKRFGVLADLAIEQRLGQARPDEKAALRAELEQPLREQFGQLMDIQEDNSLDGATKAIKGTEVGNAALAAFSQALNQAEIRSPDLKTLELDRSQFPRTAQQPTLVDATPTPVDTPIPTDATPTLVDLPTPADATPTVVLPSPVHTAPQQPGPTQPAAQHQFPQPDASQHLPPAAHQPAWPGPALPPPAPPPAYQQPSQPQQPIQEPGQGHHQWWNESPVEQPVQGPQFQPGQHEQWWQRPATPQQEQQADVQHLQRFLGHGSPQQADADPTESAAPDDVRHVKARQDQHRHSEGDSRGSAR